MIFPHILLIGQCFTVLHLLVAIDGCLSAAGLGAPFMVINQSAGPSNIAGATRRRCLSSKQLLKAINGAILQLPKGGPRTHGDLWVKSDTSEKE